MASVQASSGVKLKASTGSLSGSTIITGFDGKGDSKKLATITASGSPTKGGGAFSAGSDSNWSLTVTYNTDGTATGSAAGSYLGVGSTVVPVAVDAPGKPRHRSSTKRPAKRKAAKSRTVARRTKAPTRKKAKAPARKKAKAVRKKKRVSR